MGVLFAVAHLFGFNGDRGVLALDAEVQEEKKEAAEGKGEAKESEGGDKDASDKDGKKKKK